MIEKRSHVPAFDPVHGQNVFVLPDRDGLEKTASIVKVAQVSEEISRAIDELKPEAGHRYVLVNAMGAYEYWGPNRNHDAFPETGLKFGGDDYGYRTFKTAWVNVHHDNKELAKSVGAVKCATYNDRMHRIELLLDVDMAKLAKRDLDIYKKVASGEWIDCSMGSRCDFDLATCCGNKAAHRGEYCDHLRKHGGEIMPDGRRIAAYTPHPRFFDISFVTKGADVTAKALHYLDKQASDGPELQAVPECPDPSAHAKVAAEAPASGIPDLDADHLAAALLVESVEERIPAAALDKMAALGLPETLSTCSHLGIVLSPEEYQRVALVSMGLGELADKCASAGAVIDPSGHGTWFDASLKPVPSQFDPARFSAKVAEIVADFVQGRTILEPYFSARAEKISRLPDELISKIASARHLEKDASNFLTPGLAAALALGYLIYRRGIPFSDMNTLRKSVSDPEMAKKVVTVVIPLLAAGSVVDRVMSYEPPTASKTAGIGTEVVLPVAGTYLYSAHARRKAERGQPVSGLEHMFLEYPLPLSLAGIAGIAALKSRLKRTAKIGSGMISRGFNGNAEMIKDASAIPSLSDVALSLGSGVYRPRASGLLGMLADSAIMAGIGATLAKAKSLVTKDQSNG